MRTQAIISITLFVILVSSAQGLFLKKSAIKNKLSTLSSMNGDAEPERSGGLNGEAATMFIEGAVPVRYVPRFYTVPLSVYSYAPYYQSPVYYQSPNYYPEFRPAVSRLVSDQLKATFGGVGRTVGKLAASPVRAIGNLKSTFTGALENAFSLPTESSTGIA